MCMPCIHILLKVVGYIFSALVPSGLVFVLFTFSTHRLFENVIVTPMCMVCTILLNFKPSQRPFYSWMLSMHFIFYQTIPSTMMPTKEYIDCGWTFFCYLLLFSLFRFFCATTRYFFYIFFKYWITNWLRMCWRIKIEFSIIF